MLLLYGILTFIFDMQVRFHTFEINQCSCKITTFLFFFFVLFSFLWCSFFSSPFFLYFSFFYFFFFSNSLPNKFQWIVFIVKTFKQVFGLQCTIYTVYWLNSEQLNTVSPWSGLDPLNWLIQMVGPVQDHPLARLLLSLHLHRYSGSWREV